MSDLLDRVLGPDPGPGHWAHGDLFYRPAMSPSRDEDTAARKYQACRASHTAAMRRRYHGHQARGQVQADPYRETTDELRMPMSDLARRAGVLALMGTILVMFAGVAMANTPLTVFCAVVLMVQVFVSGRNEVDMIRYERNGRELHRNLEGDA